jgi:hypothetical protein
MQSIGFTKSAMLLLAGVSSIALTAASSKAGATDLMPAPIVAEAPAIRPEPRFEWFLEGAGFRSRGDPIHLTDFAAPQVTPKPGWQIAAGVNYRFASPWHVSAQFRYARAGTHSENIPYYAGSGFAWSHKESHWVADFAVGRDIGIGVGTAQAKLGLRVAEIKAKTDGLFYYFGPPYPLSQDSRFLGFGPRAALEGSVPLVGGWSVDYTGGGAMLFGKRKFEDASFSVTRSFDQSGTVFNADASAALAYSFLPDFKLSAGYRFDGYWNVLRTFDSDGDVTNVNRIFHGPFVRATVRF